MNRIRTIATAGIVAGSVAFAAALLSSGGVGASFVDAAEASASISVADHLDGLEPTGCNFTLHVDGKAVDLGQGQLPFALSEVAEDGGDGLFTASLDFDISSPDPQNFDIHWHVTPDGDLTSHATSGSHRLSVTFWWPKPTKDHHVQGSAFITLTCTPRSDHAGDHGGDHGGGQPDNDGLVQPNSIDDAGSKDASPGISDSSDDPVDSSPETYSFEAAVDLPSVDDDAACGQSTSDSENCTTDAQPDADCAVDGADASDPEKCPITTPPTTDPSEPATSDPNS